MDDIERNIMCCPHNHGIYRSEESDFLVYDAVVCDEGCGVPMIESLEACRECMLDQMHGYEVDHIDGTR